METSPALSLDYFYKMVLKDFTLISEKNVIATSKITEGIKADEKKLKEDIDKMPLNQLLSNGEKYLYGIFDKEKADHKIFASVCVFYKQIKDFLEKSDDIKGVVKTDEKDIYKAYIFLWSARFLLKEKDLNTVSSFNKKEYLFISEFLDKFGNSKNLSRNYNINFLSELKGRKLDIKFVYDWLQKITQGKLSPMSISSKNSKRKKKKQDKTKELDDEKKEKENCEIQSNQILNDIDNSIKYEGKENNMEDDNSKNITSNISQEENINQNTKIPIEKISSGSNSNNSENETANSNSEINKSEKCENLIISKEIVKVPSVELIKKNDSIFDLYKIKNPQISPEISQLINFFSDKFDKLQNQMEDKNKEQSKKMEEQDKKISQNKEEISKLNQKIKKLELNQLMMFHQISMYQNSRDLFKNICYYFYEYLNLKQVRANRFAKTQAIIEYLESDGNKLKEMHDKGATLIPEHIKKKIINYLRFHNFVHLTINKIIHRNFEESQKEVLKEIKDDELISLIPSFDFEQSFDSLEFFLENNSKNKQIRAAMQIVYENIYLKDNELNNLKDINQEVIKNDENGITLMIKKSDIEEVKNYFKGIKIGEKDFDKLCNEKTWDITDLSG